MSIDPAGEGLEDYDDYAPGEDARIMPFSPMETLPSHDAHGREIEWSEEERQEIRIGRLRALYLSGLVVPGRLMRRGRYPKELRDQWVQLVRVLIGRGLDDVGLLSQVLDIDRRNVERWFQEAHQFNPAMPGLFDPGAQDQLRQNMMMRARARSNIALSELGRLRSFDPNAAAKWMQRALDEDDFICRLAGLHENTLPTTAPAVEVDDKATPEEVLAKAGVQDPKALLKNMAVMLAYGRSYPGGVDDVKASRAEEEDAGAGHTALEEAGSG